MKELGYVRTFLLDNKSGKFIEDLSSRLKYAEPFDEKNFEVEYENIIGSFDIHKPGIFDKREYKYRDLWHRDKIIIVKKGEKLIIKQVWEKRKFTYSFDELARYLSAEEFIEYLKDHGMNTCPMRMED